MKGNKVKVFMFYRCCLHYSVRCNYIVVSYSKISGENVHKQDVDSCCNFKIVLGVMLFKNSELFLFTKLVLTSVARTKKSSEVKMNFG